MKNATTGRAQPMGWLWALVLLGACERAPAPVVVIAAPVNPDPPQGEAVAAVLTDAPQVPAATGRKAPAQVVVDLVVKEVTRPIAEGVDYVFWTFGGHVPGKFIRIRHGDTVEFHLSNDPGNKMPHNIDLHAVTGPGGGAASSFTAPGHTSVFTFKALNPGLFIYHCATAPVGMHIANGMYGMIFVEPQEGLSPVDREFYVMQGDFYTVGRYREKGLQPFDMQKAIDEKPTYVLFNGSEDSLLGERALKVKTGERVRLFLGNGGPNLVSSFHMIGEIFDRVYWEGGSHYQENVQTTLIPAGGAAIIEFTVDVPGTYLLVDHSIFRTFNKGALAMLKAEGADRKELYSGKEVDEVYLGDKAPQAAADPIAKAATLAPGGKLTLEAQLAAGKELFAGTCSVCHQLDGKGLPNVFPPLAGSDYLMADKQRSIGIPLNGLQGEVVVNGMKFVSVMPPMSQLTDDGIANILTYVRNAFGNQGEAVTPEEVAKVRATTRRPAGAAQ